MTDREQTGDNGCQISALPHENFTKVKKISVKSIKNSTNCGEKENNLEIRLQS